MLSSAVNTPGCARAGLRILLVDDCPDSLCVFARLLRMSGHDAVTASTVADARQAAEGGGLDLLVSDIQLPDGSGVRLMRELRERFAIPGIAVTGWGPAGADGADGWADAGFAELLRKPILFEDLVAAIDRVARPPAWAAGRLSHSGGKA